MEAEAVSDISSEGMRRFVRHLCVLSKRHEQRERARQGLDMQLRKVKEITLTQKPRKWLIEQELRELERKISIAIENERRLVGMGHADSNLIRQLRDETFRLQYELRNSEVMRREEVEKNREIISDLVNSIADLREKISSLAEREERIRAIEKKLKKESRAKRR